MYTPVDQVLLYKVGRKGVFVTRTCFRDVWGKVAPSVNQILLLFFCFMFICCSSYFPILVSGLFWSVTNTVSKQYTMCYIVHVVLIIDL